MLLFIASNVIASVNPPQSASAVARIRVERGVAASAKEWQRPSPAKRREIIIEDRHGQKILLRLLEFE